MLKSLNSESSRFIKLTKKFNLKVFKFVFVVIAIHRLHRAWRYCFAFKCELFKISIAHVFLLYATRVEPKWEIIQIKAHSLTERQKSERN